VRSTTFRRLAAGLALAVLPVGALGNLHAGKTLPIGFGIKLSGTDADNCSTDKGGGPQLVIQCTVTDHVFPDSAVYISFLNSDFNARVQLAPGSSTTGVAWSERKLGFVTDSGVVTGDGFVDLTGASVNTGGVGDWVLGVDGAGGVANAMITIAPRCRFAECRGRGQHT